MDAIMNRTATSAFTTRPNAMNAAASNSNATARTNASASNAQSTRSTGSTQNNQNNNRTTGNPALDRADTRRQEINSNQQRVDSQQQNSIQNRLQNVVSMSRDGDTVQVRPGTQEAANRANEGSITRREDEAAARMEAQRERQQKAEEARQARLEAIKAQQEQQQQQDSQQQITSFAGYTASQIEQLYQQGRISRQDYENQMAAKQEQTASATETNSANARDAARLSGTLTRAQMDASAINNAMSNANSVDSTRAASERLSAMQRVADQQTQQRVNTNNEGRRTWDYQLQA